MLCLLQCSMDLRPFTHLRCSLLPYNRCFMMPLQILRQDGPQGLYRGFLAVAVGDLRLLACVEHV